MANVIGYRPVFDAVRDPQSHPDIFYLLLQLNGWDSVDDESVVSKYTSEGGSLPLPEAWIEPTNPPYSYWGYYMYANIRSLNYLLAARGMRTLPFRFVLLRSSFLFSTKSIVKLTHCHEYDEPVLHARPWSLRLSVD